MAHNNAEFVRNLCNVVRLCNVVNAVAPFPGAEPPADAVVMAAFFDMVNGLNNDVSPLLLHIILCC